MSEQTIAASAPDAIRLRANDKAELATPGRLVGIVLSLLILTAAFNQMGSIRARDILALIPTSLLFWIVFAVSYLAGPASEWIIFQRLWHVGPAAFGALVRKLIYNEMLVGYLGEAYFYSWARRHLSLVASPFGAVKDVAVLSAVAGNAVTLIFLVIAAPYLSLLPIHEYARPAAWSLAFVIGTSLITMMWRKAIFSLDRAELTLVSLIHVGRILATTGLSALLWHLVIPNVAFVWWLVLATIRLLISRLPFVPNKDLVFAGVAILAVGNDAQIGELMTMMAALILLTHILVGVSFAISDLIFGDRNVSAAG